MKFEEAFALMREGKKLRPLLGAYFFMKYCYVNDNNFYFNNGEFNQRAFGLPNPLIFSEWEVYDDKSI